jgi:hypothetical protein
VQASNTPEDGTHIHNEEKPTLCAGSVNARHVAKIKKSLDLSPVFIKKHWPARWRRDRVAHEVPQWGFLAASIRGQRRFRQDDRKSPLRREKHITCFSFFKQLWEEKVVTNASGRYSEITVSEAFSLNSGRFDL